MKSNMTVVVVVNGESSDCKKSVFRGSPRSLREYSMQQQNVVNMLQRGGTLTRLIMFQFSVMLHLKSSSVDSLKNST